MHNDWQCVCGIFLTIATVFFIITEVHVIIFNCLLSKYSQDIDKGEKWVMSMDRLFALRFMHCMHMC